MAAHRYWRFNVTDATHGTHVDVRDIAMRILLGGSDVTGSGTASASAEAGGFEASKAFDHPDDPTTWYFNRVSNPLPQWIKYDFGAGNDKDIIEYTLRPWSSPEMIKSWDFQWSDDNSAWTTAHTVTGATWSEDTETRVYTFGSDPSSGARPVVFVCT
jgi:hypothetical protein